jgi:hypothetical protein
MFMFPGFRRDIYSKPCHWLQMKTISRRASIGGLGILAIVLMAAPLITATFAWVATPGSPFTCVTSTGVWSPKCTADPSFAIGTKVYDTVHISFSTVGPYYSVVFAVANGTCTLPSGAPGYGSAFKNTTVTIPTTPTISSINVTTSVITTKYDAGSYVWLVHYTGGSDGYARYPSKGNDCEPFTLTSLPPPTSVPEFPFGIALLMAMAVPALVLFKRKFSLSNLQAL